MSRHSASPAPLVLDLVEHVYAVGPLAVQLGQATDWQGRVGDQDHVRIVRADRKSTRLNSSHRT